MSRNARHILWSLHISESETYTQADGRCLGFRDKEVQGTCLGMRDKEVTGYMSRNA